MSTEKNTLHIIQLLSLYLLAIPGFAVLLSFIWLGQYAHPSADDFCMAAGVKHEGLFPYLWNHYFEWSGRYLGNALYGVYPLVFGMFDGIKFMPALLIFLLLLAFAYFLSKLFSLSMTTKPIMLASVCFVSIYLLGMKHTASSLYWPAGALSYQTANILFLLTLGLIIQLMDRQRHQKNYSLVLAPLILVIVLGMGTNETNMLALSAILVLAFVIHLRSGWNIVKPWLLLLFVALVCFAIVYFSPGNTIRESTFPLRHDLWRAINGSLDMGLWVLTGWLVNPVFIATSLLTPFAVSRLYYLSNRSLSISKSLLAALILVTLSIPFVLQFPAWWAMGGWPPPRTVDAIFFVFMLSWYFMLGAITIRFFSQSLLLSAEKPVSAYVAIAVLLGAVFFSLAVFGSFKFQRIQLDLRQRAEPFHEYMLKRYSLINETVTNQQSSLPVPAFNREYPRSIYFNDIVPDSRDWRNVCYADYFGLQEITRERRLEKSKHKVKKLRPPQNSYY